MNETRRRMAAPGQPRLRTLTDWDAIEATEFPIACSSDLLRRYEELADGLAIWSWTELTTAKSWHIKTNSQPPRSDLVHNLLFPSLSE